MNLKLNDRKASSISLKYASVATIIAASYPLGFLSDLGPLPNFATWNIVLICNYLRVENKGDELFYVESDSVWLLLT